MRINEYGNYTIIFYKDYSRETVPGHPVLFLNERHLKENTDIGFVVGYSYMRHGKTIQSYGETRMGWVVSEVIGMTVVNPKAIGILK